MILDKLCECVRMLKTPIVYLTTTGDLYGTDENTILLKHTVVDLKPPIDIMIDKNAYEVFYKMYINNKSLYEIDMSDFNNTLNFMSMYDGVIINDFRRMNVINVINRTMVYLTNDIFYHNDNIRNEEFNRMVNKPTSDGMEFYILDRSISNVLLPLYKGLLNLTKSDKVSINLHVVDGYKYFAHYIIRKPKSVIIDVYTMVLYL